MSQPELAYGVNSSDNVPCAQPDRVQHDGEMRSPPEGEATDQRDEIDYWHGLDHQKAKRIEQLEQALDQALACLDELRSRIHDQTILQEQLETAEEFVYVQQQAIERLRAELDRQRQDKRSLERTIQRNQITVAEQVKAIAELHHDTALAQNKVEELESELAHHLKSQARWQQQYQELQANHDGCQTRLTNIEQQHTEMQEQILGQARQASEYEAAVQYWKDRYVTNHRHISHLKALVEHQITTSADDESNALLHGVLSEVLAVIQLIVPTETDEPPRPTAVPSPRFSPIDVPDFLLRRTYRTRSSPPK